MCLNKVAYLPGSNIILYSWSEIHTSLAQETKLYQNHPEYYEQP